MKDGLPRAQLPVRLRGSVCVCENYKCVWTSENCICLNARVCVRERETVRVFTPDLIVLVREPDQGSNLLNWLKEHNKIISAKLVKFLLRMFIKINAKEVNKKKNNSIHHKN